MMKSREKMFAAVLISVFLMITAGCAKANTPAPAPAAPSAAASGTPAPSSATQTESASGAPALASDAKIGVMLREYEGDSLVEILMVEADGANPEIDALNSDIKSGVFKDYEEFKASGNDISWLEIRSYPFTSEDYLQIVTTSATYPSYGTDGVLTSFCYDRKEGRYVKLDDMLKKIEFDKNGLLQTVQAAYVPETEQPETVESAEIRGFVVREDGQKQSTLLLLNIILHYPEADDDRSAFFAYSPESNELMPLERDRLFEPSELDQFDPPLSYGR